MPVEVIGLLGRLIAGARCRASVLGGLHWRGAGHAVGEKLRRLDMRRPGP